MELQLKYDAEVIEKDMLMVKLENTGEVVEKQVMEMEDQLVELNAENQSLRLKLCIPFQPRIDYHSRLQEDLDNCELLADNMSTSSEDGPSKAEAFIVEQTEDGANDKPLSLSADKEGFVPLEIEPVDVYGMPVSAKMPLGCQMISGSDAGYSSVELSPAASNLLWSVGSKSLDGDRLGGDQSCSFNRNHFRSSGVDNDGVFIRKMSRDTSDTSPHGSEDEKNGKCDTHFDKLLLKLSSDVQSIGDESEKVKLAQTGLRDSYNNMMSESLLQGKHFCEHIDMYKALRMKYKSMKQAHQQQVKYVNDFKIKYKDKEDQMHEGNKKLIEDIIKMQVLFEDTQSDHNSLKETCTDLENRLLLQYDEYSTKMHELGSINELLLASVDSDVSSLEAAHIKLKAEHTVVMEENAEMQYQLEDLRLLVEKNRKDLRIQLQDAEHEINYLTDQLTSVKQQSDHNLSTLEYNMVDEMKHKEASNVQILHDKNRFELHNQELSAEIDHLKRRNDLLKSELDNMTDKLEHVCTTSMQDVDRLEGEKLDLVHEYNELAEQALMSDKIRRDTENLYGQLQQRCEQLIIMHQGEKAALQDNLNMLQEKIKFKEHECQDVIETCSNLKVQKITIEQDLTDIQMCHRNLVSHLENSDNFSDADIFTIRKELKHLSQLAKQEGFDLMKDDMCDVNMPSGNIHYSSTPRISINKFLSDDNLDQIECLAIDIEIEHGDICDEEELKHQDLNKNTTMLCFQLSYLKREVQMFQNRINELEKQLKVQSEIIESWKSRHFYAISRGTFHLTESNSEVHDIWSLDGSKLDDITSSATLIDHHNNIHVSMPDSDAGIDDIELCDELNLAVYGDVSDTQSLFSKIFSLQTLKHKLLMKSQKMSAEHQQLINDKDTKYHLVRMRVEALQRQLIEREVLLQKLCNNHHMLLDTVEEQCKLREVSQLSQDLDCMWKEGQQYHLNQISIINQDLNDSEQRLSNQQHLLCQRAGDLIIGGKPFGKPSMFHDSLPSCLQPSDHPQIYSPSDQQIVESSEVDMVKTGFKNLQGDLINRHLAALEAMKDKLESL